MNLLFFTIALLFAASPADAAAVGLAIAGIAGWIGSTAVGAFVFRIVAGVVLSALSRALKRKPKQQVRGLVTEVTLSGGINPDSFIIGRYATGGTFVAPPLSHGPRLAYLTNIIDLSMLPGCTLSRLFVNGEAVVIGAGTHADYGSEIEGEYQGLMWIKYYDGSQTVADPMLLAKYATDPDFPWSADMIGTGRCYAILTSKYDEKKLSGHPQFRFEMDGAPFYDPRKDSSAGGSGTHRWDDQATWEQTDNTAILAYNVTRGITFADGSRWGGEATDLPLPSFAAAMNECDVAVALEAGGTEPQYRAGYEVRVDQEPAEVLELLMAGCSGDMVEVGGEWFIHIGAPPMPLYYLTDENIIVSEPQELDPWPGLAEMINGVAITYPDPDSAWEGKDAPPRYRSDLEAQDRDRQLVADLDLKTVPYAMQVQRVGAAYIDDHRRFRKHTLTLPPDAAFLNPLNAISWTSERNGYSGKLFEIGRKETALRNLLSQVVLRERDPSDYDWSPSQELPTYFPPAIRTGPPAYVLSGVSVAPHSIQDQTGADRSPAVLLTWDQIDGGGIEWRLRVEATSAVVAQGYLPNGPAGSLVISEGILPNTTYEISVIAVVPGATDWSDWLSVTSPNLLIQGIDLAASAVMLEKLAQDVLDDIDSAGNAGGSAAIALAAAQSSVDAKDVSEAASEVSVSAAGNSTTAAAVAQTAQGLTETALSLATNEATASEVSRIASEAAFSSAIALERNDQFEFGLAGWKRLGGAVWDNITTDVGLTANAALNVPDPDTRGVGGRMIPVKTNHVYKGVFRAKSFGGISRCYAGVVTHAADGSVLTGGAGTHRYFTAEAVDIPDDGEWHEISGTITGTGNDHFEFRTGTVFVSPMWIANSSGSTNTHLLVDECSIDDVTGVEGNAAIFAAAFVSENKSATSEENSALSEAAAALSVTLVATSEFNVGVLAVAVAEDVVVVTTKATETASNATAANQAKIGAETARAGAELAETNTATSAEDAEDAKAVAVVSAGQSAASKDLSANEALASIAAAAISTTKAGEAVISAENSELSNQSAIVAKNTASGHAESTAADVVTTNSNVTSTSADAGAVNTAKIGAETAQGISEAASALAVTSASDAEGHEGASAINSTQSAISKNLAGDFADAAALEATLAQTKATEAGTKADAAGASEIAAEAAFSNAVALGRNEQFEFGITGWNRLDGAAWDTIDLDVGPTANAALKITEVNTWGVGERKVPIDISRVYEGKIRLKSIGGTSQVFGGVVTYDADGAVLTGGAGVHRYFTAEDVSVPDDGEWHEFTGSITGTGNDHFEFRTGTIFASSMWWVNAAGSTNTHLLLDECSFDDVTDREGTSASFAAAFVSETKSAESEANSIEAASTATTKASQAAQSEIDAGNHAEATAVDVVTTGSDVTLTNANAASTASDVISAEASKVNSGLNATATAADVVTTGGDVTTTNANALATAANVITVIAAKNDSQAAATATAADVVTTSSNVGLTSADASSTASDVISAEAAKDDSVSAATASAGHAGNALASETGAGTQAAASLSSANTATAGAATSTTKATEATQAKEDAETATAIAVSAKDTAVSVASQGVGALSDQFMPTGWVDWNAGPTYAANEIYATGQTAQWDIGAVNAGVSIQSGQALWAGGDNASAYRVEIEFELVSGSISGAGVVLDWQSTAASFQVAVPLADMLIETVETGRITLASTVIERPSSYSGTWSLNELFLMANDPTLGAISAKNIKVHRAQLFQITSTEAAIKQTAVAVADLEGNADAIYVIRAKAGSAEALFEIVVGSDPINGLASSIRAVADDIILEGSVSARHMTIQEFLDMDEDNSGFRMGKQSVSDFATNGVYMGRTGNGDFGFFAGLTEDGQSKYIQITPDLFRIKDAEFLINAGTLSAVNQTSSGTYSLSGSATIAVTLSGGGGGGSGGSDYASNGGAGGNGGATTVILKDGTTTMYTWSAFAGVGGASGGRDGAPSQSSPYGKGGNGGSAYNNSAQEQYGSYGQGGSAAQTTTGAEIDISGYADPKLVITVGAAGHGGSGGGAGSSGSSGGGGVVKYNVQGEANLVAAPLTVLPAANGNLSLTAYVPGNFPSLAPYRGLWVLWGLPNNTIIGIGNDNFVTAPNGVVSFIASETPTWTSNHSSSATAGYQYFPM